MCSCVISQRNHDFTERLRRQKILRWFCFACEGKPFTHRPMRSCVAAYFLKKPQPKGDFENFRRFFCYLHYEFILFERPSVSLKWILLVIFLCCRTVMPCRTLCHSELLVDRHFLKCHGSFFVLFILLEAAGSASPVSILYLIVFAYQ